MANCKAEKKSEGPSMRRFKYICVFGSPNIGKNYDFLAAANELGKALAARGINLVYGGGIRGLSGGVATSAIVKGSRVLGITVKDLMDKNPVHYTVGTEIQVSSLPERMGYMFFNAEAFIALPSGLETLEGISNIAYWASLNFHKKPLGLLNINGFYDGLLFFLDQAVKQEFMSQAARRTIISASTVDQLLDQLQTYAPEPDPLPKQVDLHDPKSRKRDEPDTTLRL